MFGLNSQTIPVIVASVVLFVIVIYSRPKGGKILLLLSAMAPPSIFLLGFMRSVATSEQIERPWYLIAFVTTLFYSSIGCAIIFAIEQLRKRASRKR